MLTDSIAIGDYAVVFQLAPFVTICNISPISVVKIMKPLLGVFVQLYDICIIGGIEYYINLAKTFIDAGADEICLKDMAGIGRPESLGKIVAGIKAYKEDIII